MIPITEEQENKLKWTDFDIDNIDSILTGLTIVGAETVGYPHYELEGVVLYAKDKQGKLFVLDIGIDSGEFIVNTAAVEDIKA